MIDFVAPMSSSCSLVTRFAAFILPATLASAANAMPTALPTINTETATPVVQVNARSSELPSSLMEVTHSGFMKVHVREGQLLQLPRAAAKVLIADPRIANFQIPSPTSVFVFALTAGTTTLYALDAADKVIAAVRVVAEHDLESLRSQILRSIPGADINLEPSLNNRILVRGKVRTPLEARDVVDQIQAYLDGTSTAAGGGAQGGGGSAGGRGGVINQLKVELSSQVNIQVRVVEVSRTMSHELGFNWGAMLTNGSGRLAFGSGNATSLFDAVSQNNIAPLMPGVSTTGAALAGYSTRGRFTLGGLVSALASEGMATLLAEPNLTALSGESAAFAAGGEVPIVLFTNNNVQIDFKSYGVILRMTPTLLSRDRISLHIAPEVSELTTEGSVQLPGGSTVPALKVRRADTTVELASGQSFALAGMLRSTASQQVSGLPGLKDVPWLGRAFEREASRKEDSELVIIVTANVVDPVSAGDLQVPGQGLPTIDQLLPTQAAAGYLY